MKPIEITVREKVARLVDPDAFIVCGNSKYTVSFEFDAEWDEYDAKTACFKWNGQKEEVVFTGNQCKVPIIRDTVSVEIGVYAGDLQTTTGALVNAKKSILCGTEKHHEPESDVYNQIMELLKSLEGVSDEELAAAVEAYFVENPLPENHGVKTFGWGLGREPFSGATYDAIVLVREDGKFLDIPISSILNELDKNTVTKALGYTPAEKALPEIVETDEGKVLRVSDGDAAWTEDIAEVLPPSSNLLPPESLPKRINLTDGVTLEGSATLERHTPERIPFPYARAYVMLSPAYEGNFGPIAAILCYDENDAYLGYTSIKPTSVGTNFSTAVKTGTAYIRVWTNNGLAFEYVAISGEKITEWETFFPGGYAVREDALPWDTVRERTRPLYGKVIANFGDSIFGNKRPPKDISTALSDITGATVYNLGFGGCRMGAHHRAEYDAFSMYRLADSVASGNFALQDAVDVSSVSDMPSYFTKTRDLLKSIDWDKVDIVTIAYGTNDFTGGNTLDDAEDFGDYAYSLRYSIETLLTAYPHLKIFVCGQTYRFWFNDSGEFDYDSDTYTYKAHKLTDFVAKTAEVCAEYHLPFIDNYDGLGINKFNRGQYFPANDGTHHNAAGARLIAEHMARKLF